MADDKFEYKDRSVGAWLRDVADGSVGLPTFQRSYVWTEREKIGNYLTALLQDRPTGVFLVLVTDDEPRFPSRRLRDAPSGSGKVREQILDGQQRLTSLWHAVSPPDGESYYLRVTDFTNIRLRQAEVTWPRTRRERTEWANPQMAHAAGVVPLSILMDPDHTDGMRIWEWCDKVHPQDGTAARVLEVTITNKILRKFLDQRWIHYCVLPASTTRGDAINIFIQSNQSSVKVTEFDIAVALATDRSEGEEDLRDRIAAFNRGTPVIRHYLRDPDSEAAISELGHWMLMAGCLDHLKSVPQKRRFEELITKLISTKPAIGDQLDALLESVESALKTHASAGAPTLSTLPTRPSVHVLAGLDRHLKAFCQTRPPSRDRRLVNTLIQTYIWRAFTTDRYDAQANNRLHTDFQGLRACLRAIGEGRTLLRDDLPPIFDDEVLDEAALASLEEGRTIGWIKTTNRQGRSIAALTLSNGAIDWATGQKFDNDRVRDLEHKGDLHGHHVFPKALLEKNGFSREQINHGLNGVLLSANTNRSFAKADPREYLESLLNEDHCPSQEQLKRWVESHFVPYDVLMATDSVALRYRAFIKERAWRVASEFEKRTQPSV